MSRFTSPRRSVLSSWPVATWNLRLSSSRRAEASLFCNSSSSSSASSAALVTLWSLSGSSLQALPEQPPSGWSVRA